MAEVIAISALLWKAAEFLPQLRDGLYKGSVELDQFQIKVAILRAKHAQWASLLQKFGMTEDEHLKPLVEEAVQILDKEKDYATRLKKSRFMRLRRRAFPGKLNWILSSLADIVDASHQLLQTRVETNDLLVRSLRQTSCLLPFGPDRKYVPLLGSIRKVQNALEDADGRSVVTVHGGPGMGKSSLVKYLALHYEQVQKQQIFSRAPTTIGFPDGVFYLLCGRGAQARVKQLQMNLLESLGGGFESSAQSNECNGALEEEGGFVHLPSHHTKLRFCLAERKSLIILDDVWEVDILENLLLPGASVKYLVTSQIRTICSDATMIELKSPTKKEARKILANYTQGLPTTGEFPQNIKSVTDAIIQELQYHPLSLANIGTSINSSRATHPGEWKAVKDSLWESNQLDENEFCISPLVYGRRYPLTLHASMMLMVDSLHPKARQLLFLMGLLTGPQIPEVVVKFFFNQIESTDRRNKYRRGIKYLEDTSLVAYHNVVTDEVHNSKPVLVTHGLRNYYIRRNHTMDMLGISTEIFLGGSRLNNHHGDQLVESGCPDGALVTIMGAMYFEKPFKDVVPTKLESQSRIFNCDVMPRSMNYDVDALDLMERAEELKGGLASLIWLLNPDGEGGWKQQAHEYTKKIVIRLTFRNELDDESMAGLIQLPHTTTAACKALKYIVDHLEDALEDAFVDENITFSSAYGQTMKSLNDIGCLHDNALDKDRYFSIFEGLGRILHYESEDTILSIAKKWVELLANDSNCNPVLQIAVAHAILSMVQARAQLLVGEFPGFLDHLLKLMPTEAVQVQARYELCGSRTMAYEIEVISVWAICDLCYSSTVASKIAAIPGALEVLFQIFLSKNHGGNYNAGVTLHRLSCIPENRVRFTTIRDGLGGLTNMLTSNPKSESSVIDYDLSALSAAILANLAMTNEVRNFIITSFPDVKEKLRLLQLSYFSRNYGPREETFPIIWAISRAVTIFNPLQVDPKMTSSPLPPPRVCYEAYVGRVYAYRQMQMYSKALESVNIAHQYYQHMSSKSKNMYTWQPAAMSRFRIFSKAMLEDYAGAMLDATSAVENYEKENGTRDPTLLVERGVLRRLAGTDLAEALADLDEAFKLMPRPRTSRNKEIKYCCLKHRGLVKLMMGDEDEARADAEAALKLKFRWFVSERSSDALGPHWLIDLPVNYLGFSL